MSTVFINSYLQAAPWYLSGGSPVPIVAYQPKGAASLAASDDNLPTPGTYDAAPVVTPTWATGTGWTGTGTQYLQFGDLTTTSFIQNTGVFTVLSRVRLANHAADAAHAFFGNLTGSDAKGFFFFYENRSVVGSPKRIRLFIANGTAAVVSAGSANNAITDNNSHVVAVVGNGTNFQTWVDGVKSGSPIAGTGGLSSGNSSRVCLLMATATATTPTFYFVGDHAAHAIYNVALTDSQVIAVSAAAAAL